MKILLLSPILPVPTTGTGTREYNLIKRLSRENDFIVVSLMRGTDDVDASLLRPYCAELIGIPFAPPAPPVTKGERWRNRAKGWAQALLCRDPRYTAVYPLGLLHSHARQVLERHPDIDLVHAIGLCTAPIVNALPLSLRLLTAIDVESDKHRQFLALGHRQPIHRRFLQWLEWRKVRRFERQQVSQVDICVAVSEPDRRLLAQLAPDTRIEIVPNGADTGHFEPPCSQVRIPYQVLFFGNFDYSPNADAARYFCEDIWPLVIRQCPQAELLLIGPNAPAEVQNLAIQHDGVRFVGFVDDIRYHLWQATLTVVPLRIGGGTRLKILEALAAECAVVSTTIGAAGLDLKPDYEIMIADKADLFARHVVYLLQNEQARVSLAKRGMLAVRERYDWDRIADQQQAVYRHALHKEQQS